MTKFLAIIGGITLLAVMVLTWNKGGWLIFAIACGIYFSMKENKKKS